MFVTNRESLLLLLHGGLVLRLVVLDPQIHPPRTVQNVQEDAHQKDADQPIHNHRPANRTIYA